MFANNGSCFLESLTRHANALWRTLWDVYVQQRPLRDPLGERSSSDVYRNACRLGKIRSTRRNQAEREPGDAEYRRLHGTGDRSRICRVTTQIRTVVYTRYADVGSLAVQ